MGELSDSEGETSSRDFRPAKPYLFLTKYKGNHNSSIKITIIIKIIIIILVLIIKINNGNNDQI